MATNLIVRRLCWLRRKQVFYGAIGLKNCVKPFAWETVRFIQSSNKNGPKQSGDHPINAANPEYGGDADIHLSKGFTKRPPGPKTVEEFANPASQKNWISYGFDYVDMREDRYMAHLSFFCLITVCMVWPGFLLYYWPDFRLHDWATREAFLELERRKKMGLPIIDRNYVDPSKVILPTEEELGDTEVII